MPWAIQTRIGREKAIRDLLLKLGIDSDISPMGQYLVCKVIDIPEYVRKNVNVVKCLTVSDDEASSMLRHTVKPEEPPIVEGSPVLINISVYSDFVGRVVAIDNNNKATVHLTVFGKIVPVTTEISNLRLVERPEVWV